jgi:hypothetical protein
MKFYVLLIALAIASSAPVSDDDSDSIHPPARQGVKRTRNSDSERAIDDEIFEFLPDWIMNTPTELDGGYLLSNIEATAKKKQKLPFHSEVCGEATAREQRLSPLQGLCAPTRRCRGPGKRLNPYGGKDPPSRLIPLTALERVKSAVTVRDVWNVWNSTLRNLDGWHTGLIAERNDGMSVFEITDRLDAIRRSLCVPSNTIQGLIDGLRRKRGFTPFNSSTVADISSELANQFDILL